MFHDLIPSRRRLLGAPVLGLALALGACGGGGGSDMAAPDATPAVAADTVPATAAESPSALVAYELALKPDDRSEPLKIGNLVLPTDDRAEPIPLGM